MEGIVFKVCVLIMYNTSTVCSPADGKLTKDVLERSLWLSGSTHITVGIF